MILNSVCLLHTVELMAAIEDNTEFGKVHTLESGPARPMSLPDGFIGSVEVMEGAIAACCEE